MKGSDSIELLQRTFGFWDNEKDALWDMITPKCPKCGWWLNSHELISRRKGQEQFKFIRLCRNKLCGYHRYETDEGDFVEFDSKRFRVKK